ncbi:uncharacterized protein LOC143237908 isoform X2 [Tachypleus tridentatus]|uniref:uncharacterized protein LOC143237908 isoform X2 n=1 Tax=Tachypleus tridentatus TaxID=6853 RepID=UPI003FD02D72
MKNRALLATFIFLACCICYSRSQITPKLIYFVFCDRRATNYTKMERYECLLNYSSVTERNAMELCQNQTLPGLSNVEFLNKFCNNLATRYQFDICFKRDWNCIMQTHFHLASRLMGWRYQ